MRHALNAILLVGCGAPPRPAPIGNTSTPPVKPPQAQRARVARYSIAWVRLSDPPLKLDKPEAVDVVEPVFAATSDKVRIEEVDDDARLRVWIPRADLAPVIVRDVELAIDGAPRGTGVGVTAHPGTRIDVSEGGRVVVEGDSLVARGDVAVDAIGEMWTPSPSTKLDATMNLFEGDVVRAAPDAKAVVLAKATGEVGARALRSDKGWTEIVAGGDELVVHGFIPTPPGGDYGEGVGIGSGDAYGISDTDRVDVPRGACLYDANGGEAIGVELGDKTRYAFHTDDAAWWNVYVGTPWGLTTVAYHVGVTCP